MKRLWCLFFGHRWVGSFHPWKGKRWMICGRCEWNGWVAV